MDKERLSLEIADVSEFTFSRSCGPGGQNVNKVNSKATMFLKINRLSLSDADKNLIRAKLASRINAHDELVISADSGRSQPLNRQRVLRRALGLILSSVQKQRTRIPTRPGKSATQRRLTAKKNRSATKQLRGTPPSS